MASQARAAVPRVRYDSWLATVTANPMLWYQTRIGIDWGEQECAVSVVGYDGNQVYSGKVGHTTAGLGELLALAVKFANPITGEHPAIVIEPTRRPLLTSLTLAGEKVLAVPGTVIAEKRGPKGKRNAAKSDARDAYEIANSARIEPHRTYEVPMPVPESIRLATMSREVHHATRARVREANRLRNALAEANPRLLEAWGPDELAESPGARAVLRAAPTHTMLAALSEDDLVAILRTATPSKTKQTARRVFLAAQALPAPLSYPQDIEDEMVAHILRLLDNVEAAYEREANRKQQMTQEALGHPAAALLSPACGMGPTVLAPIIAGAVTRRHEFSGRRAFFAFTGIVPTIEQSGGREVHRRRQTLGTPIAKATWIWAKAAVLHHPVARHYYWSLRAAGDLHPTALRKVGRHLLTGLWHVMHSGEVWDDTKVWHTTLTPEQIAEQTAAYKAKSDARRTAANKKNAANPRRKTLDQWEAVAAVNAAEEADLAEIEAMTDNNEYVAPDPHAPIDINGLVEVPMDLDESDDLDDLLAVASV